MGMWWVRALNTLSSGSSWISLKTEGKYSSCCSNCASLLGILNLPTWFLCFLGSSTLLQSSPKKILLAHLSPQYIPSSIITRLLCSVLFMSCIPSQAVVHWFHWGHLEAAKYIWRQNVTLFTSCLEMELTRWIPPWLYFIGILLDGPVWFKVSDKIVTEKWTLFF